MSAAESIAKQFTGVIPGMVTGQSSVSKVYVDDELEQRDTNISNVANAAASAQNTANQGVSAANTAQSTANSAIGIASSAKNSADIAQDRINNLLVHNGDGTKDTELIDARNPVGGTPFPVLGARLNNVDAQLADIAINATTVGARGNGVFDNSLIFKSLFEDPNIISIYVPAGTYVINPKNTIFLVSNKKITFAKGCLIKVKDNVGNWDIWLSYKAGASSLENVTIDGLNFDCNIDNNPSGQNMDTDNRQYVFRWLLGGLKTFNIKIINCYIKSCGINTIMVNGTDASNIILDNNIIMYKTKSTTVYDNSVIFFNCKDHFITNNQIYCTDNTGAGGIESHWGSGLTSGNIIKNFINAINVTNQTHPNPSTEKLQISDNIIDCANGIVLWSSTIGVKFSSLMIKNNTITCTGTGIGTYYGTDGTWKGDYDNLTIENNNIYYPLGTTLPEAVISVGTAGIALRADGDITNTIVRNNTIENFPYNGISTVSLGSMSNKRENIVIVDNVLFNPCADNSYETLTKKNCFIMSNTISGIIDNNKIYNPNKNIGYAYTITGGSLPAGFIFGRNMIPFNMRFQLYSPQINDFQHLRNDMNPTYTNQKYASTAGNLSGMFEAGDMVVVGNTLLYVCTARGAVRPDLNGILTKASDGTITYSNCENFPVRMSVKIVGTSATPIIYTNDNGVLPISTTITNTLSVGDHAITAAPPTWTSINLTAVP